MEKPHQARKGESLETHEYWVPRPEFVNGPEHFAFQLAVAHIVEEKRGVPLIEAIRACAPLVSESIHTKSDEDRYMRMNDEQIVENSHYSYLDTVSSARVPYREGTRFGCISYTKEADRAVHMHFMNAEFDPISGPLSAEKLPYRRNEVRDAMKEVRQKFPEAEEVRGNSWLYNLDSYRRLFPKSYTEHLEPSRDSITWARGTSIWGQFMDSNYRLKEAEAHAFLEKAKNIPSSAFSSDALYDALPFKPLKARGPIRDFYEEYGLL